MKLAEYAAYDATGLAELVRTGQITARELAATALTAVERLNPLLNAVVGLTDPATDDAQVDEVNRPFAGVPFLIKDLGLAMQGVPGEAGSRLMQGAEVAQADSEMLRRFRASGVTILGRTNTPELGYSTTTEPLLHGPTRNPWNLELSPGGSSGGSAAAVASGLVPIAHATDAGGSIRIPAGACGLVGLKPSRGRTPVGPNTASPVHGLAVAHIVSRTVRDTAAMLDAVAGPSSGDPFIIPYPRRRFLTEAHEVPRGLRIAFTSVAARNSARTDPACVRAVEHVASVCTQLGHHVENDRPTYDEDAFHHATRIFWSSSIAASISRTERLLGRRASPENLEAATWVTYRYGLGLNALDLESADDFTNLVCRAVGDFFTRYDILLTPTMAVPPWPLRVLDSNDPRHTAEGWYHVMFERVPFSALYNMTGQPAISLPLASDAGLPIGVQAVARYADEATLLGLASQLELAMPWSGRAPLYHASRSVSSLPATPCCSLPLSASSRSLAKL